MSIRDSKLPPSLSTQLELDRLGSVYHPTPDPRPFPPPHPPLLDRNLKQLREKSPGKRQMTRAGPHDRKDRDTEEPEGMWT